MTATVVLVTLLLMPAASDSAAAPATCETFTRSSAPLPTLVSEWFARSSDQRVLMCPQAALYRRGPFGLQPMISIAWGVALRCVDRNTIREALRM